MHLTSTPRTVLASLSAAALLASLAACSPAEQPTTEPTQEGWVDVCATTGGPAVESVTVAGNYLSQPTVEFAPGLTTDVTQRLIIGAGDETTVEEDALLSVAYSIYAGSTGEQIESQGYDELGPIPLVASTSGLMPGLLKTVGCVNTGTRVVSTIAPADAFGAEGFDSGVEPGLEGSLVIAPDETLVVVMDVVRVLDRAWGDEQAEVSGMPRVTLIAEGEPVVTIPDAAPPAELQLSVLKRGDGPVIKENSEALLHYHGVSWDTREVFDSSWSRGQVAQFAISDLVPGFIAAVEGQTIGSQVLVVIPPELGYGQKTGAANEHALAGQTLVFVIDLLFAVQIP